MVARAIFEGINRRILLDKEDSDSAYFQALTLKLEYLTKLVTAGVLACVGDDAARHRYSQEHTLVRADSVGDWVHALNNVLGGPAAQFLLPGSRDVIKDLTERVGSGDWRHSAVTALANAAEQVGADTQLGTRLALRQFFDIGVQLRNRTRGHGATTTAQQSRACPYLEAALDALATVPLSLGRSSPKSIRKVSRLVSLRRDFVPLSLGLSSPESIRKVSSLVSLRRDFVLRLPKAPE